MRDQFRESGRIILENAIAFWIERAHAQARVALYALFSRFELEMTPERWAILVRLWEEDGLLQRDLAVRTFKDEPTVSRIVDGMVKQGWIVRRADAKDGRARRVHLTSQGKNLERDLVPEARKLIARAEEGISPRDLVVTRRTLRRIFENLSS